MDELQELCRRILGPGARADETIAAVRAQAQGGDRIAMLTSAVQACRARAVADQPPPAPAAGAHGAEPSSLRAAVAGELALATARLPDRQREALALRELLGLSYEQIAHVIDIEPAAVGALLARARMRLRAERRGGEPEHGSGCEERDRALRLLACRQDSEPLSRADDEWVIAHLAQCPRCEMAHAAMLEASTCYRAWPRDRPASDDAARDGASRNGRERTPAR